MGSEGIGRGKEYQRKLPLLDRRKLFTPRDVQGEPTLISPAEGEEYGSEVHELIRTLQRELGSQESFVSITPTGSIMRGHSNTDSDIDLTVLVDYGKDRNAQKKLYGIYQNEVARLRESGILKRHIHELFIAMSPAAIKRLLYEEPKSDIGDEELDEVQLFRCAVVALCGPSVGPRVTEYRTMIADMIREMPPKKFSKTLMDLAVTAMQLEENSRDKREKRIPALTRHSRSKSNTARVGMWYTRIVISLGLGERAI